MHGLLPLPCGGLPDEPRAQEPHSRGDGRTHSRRVPVHGPLQEGVLRRESEETRAHAYQGHGAHT
jgi:hypothetical protein